MAQFQLTSDRKLITSCSKFTLVDSMGYNRQEKVNKSEDPAHLGLNNGPTSINPSNYFIFLAKYVIGILELLSTVETPNFTSLQS